MASFYRDKLLPVLIAAMIDMTACQLSPKQRTGIAHALRLTHLAFSFPLNGSHISPQLYKLQPQYILAYSITVSRRKTEI